MPSARFTVTDPKALMKACEDGIKDSAGSVMADARARTPVRTGALRRAWRLRRNPDGSQQIVNDVPYARFVEYGTRHMAPAAMLGMAVAKARGGL